MGTKYLHIIDPAFVELPIKLYYLYLLIKVHPCMRLYMRARALTVQRFDTMVPIIR